MDVETRREVDYLMESVTLARASEMSVLMSTIQALEIALGHRDWETVVHVKSALHKLADALATSDAQAS